MNKQHALSNQCIALAGLLQSLQQVQQCARFGEPSDPIAMRTMLNSTLRIDAADTLSVYGPLSALRPGLQLLEQHVSRQMNKERLEQARYAASLLILASRLAKSSAATQALTGSLQFLQDNRDDELVVNDWMVQQLARAYSEHVSVLGARVMVSGEPVYLQASENAARIRALLLAGLRSTVLWRQMGGQRFKLFIFRSTMRKETRALLEQIR